MPKPKQQKHTLPMREKARYTPWQALYLSFYHPRLFIDVIRHWRGLGWLYLLLVLAVFCVPFTVNVLKNINYFLDTQVMQGLRRIPALMIQNGQVHFDKPMPFKIENKAKQVIGIIDTTGAVQSLNNQAYPALIYLITRDHFYYRSPGFSFFKDSHEPFGPVFSQAFDPSSNEIFTGKDFIRYSHFPHLKKIVLCCIYPLVLMIFFVLLAGFFLLLGMTGQFVGRLALRVRLSFVESCRLIAVSATPALLFLFILLTMNWQFLLSGTVFLGLIALYFCIGAIAYRVDSQRLMRAGGA